MDADPGDGVSAIDAGPATDGALPETPADAAPSTGIDATPPSIDAAPPADAGCITQQLLQNPGFESGVGLPWVEVAEFPLIVDADAGFEGMPHEGNWLAATGGYGANANNLDEVLGQEVAIPADTLTLTLSGQRWVQTDEAPGSAADVMTILIRSTDGTLLEEIGRLTSADSSSDWVPVTASATGSYEGQTIRLHFHSVLNGVAPSVFALDTLSLSALVCP